jgi:hypothetical protein
MGYWLARMASIGTRQPLSGGNVNRVYAQANLGENTRFRALSSCVDRERYQEILRVLERVSLDMCL